MSASQQLIPHSLLSDTEFVGASQWVIFDHPPYSPDLATSDFHAFSHFKEYFGK